MQRGPDASLGKLRTMKRTDARFRRFEFRKSGISERASISSSIGTAWQPLSEAPIAPFSSAFTSGSIADMNMRSRRGLLVLVVSIAACGGTSSGGGPSDSGGPVGSAAQGALSLYLTTKPDAICTPSVHWVNVPFAPSGGQHTTATDK